MGLQFNPEMLIVARESRGLTQSELADILDLTQGTVSKIEGGLAPVSDALVEQISAGLKYPPTFFFQSDTVHGFNSSVFFHRRRVNLSEKLLRSIHAHINIRRFNLTRLLRSAQLSSPNQFYRLDLAEFGRRVDRIAQTVRATWHLPSGPIRSVVGAIENAGGIVVKLDFGTRQLDAISEWVPGNRPLFFLNSSAGITGDRMRLTLAHELGHIFMHHIPSADAEREANKFAGEFLAPGREIKPSLHSLDIAKLAVLKSEWRISMAALIERAFELNTITPSKRKYLHIKMASAGYKVREPAETDIPIEQPRLLQSIIDAHRRELGYSVQDLAKTVNINADEFADTYLGSGRLRVVA